MGFNRSQLLIQSLISRSRTTTTAASNIKSNRSLSTHGGPTSDVSTTKKTTSSSSAASFSSNATYHLNGGPSYMKGAVFWEPNKPMTFEDFHMPSPKAGEVLIKTKGILFVWPWVGIVINLRTEWKDRRYVGESGSKLRDQLKRRGFNPTRVHPLWNYRGHSGCAVVEFNKDWSGFNNTMSFEKAYESGFNNSILWL